MSGYLERMAASAARPASGVHPLLAGRFAQQPRPALSPEPGEVEMLVETAREPLREAPAMPVLGPLRPAKATERVESVRGAAQEQAEMRREEGETVGSQWRPPAEAAMETASHAFSSPRVVREPLVAGWREVAMPARSVPAREMSREMRIESRRAREEGDEAPAAAAQRGDPSAGFQGSPLQGSPFVQSAGQAEGAQRQKAAAQRNAAEPVAASPVASFPAVERQPPAATLATVPARREGAPPPRTPGDEAQRGGEEIQIHIGRIEVIAVPQSLQRAAPGKTQRGETLEAYLRRLDRRAR